MYLYRSAPRQRSVCAVHRPQHAGHVSCELVSDTARWLMCQRKVTHILIHILCGRLIGSHPALVNAIILVLHSVAGSMPSQSGGSSSRNVSASSYSDMPGGQGRWRRCYTNVQNQKKEIDF